jgi:hypothetical protein
MIENVLLAGKHRRNAEHVRRELPELSNAPDRECLGIAPFLTVVPHRFFNRDAYREYLSALRGCSSEPPFQTANRESQAEIGRAFRTLADINSKAWPDQLFQDDVQQLRVLDRDIHADYLRLVEGVLVPLLRPLALASRVRRQKSTDGLDPFNIVEELKGALPTSVGPYNHRMRNAIAHGGIDYVDADVVYSDKEKETRLERRAAVRAVDSLLDVCNALALGYRVFLLTEPKKTTPWPQEVLLQELQAASASPWWKIEQCITTKSFAGDQLNIHVAISTRDDTKVYFSCLQTAALVQRLVPGYQRYFFHFRSPSAWPGFAGFDGAILDQVSRNPNATIADYATALNDGLVFFVPKPKLPKLLKTLDNYRLAFVFEGLPNMREARLNDGRCIVDVRKLDRHTNPLLVTRAWAVLPNPSIQSIRENARDILGQVLRSRPQPTSLVPPGYTEVGILDQDARRRDFSRLLLGPHYVCRLARLTNPRMSVPDLPGSRVEVVDGVRIGWNRNWPALGNYLEDTGEANAS